MKAVLKKEPAPGAVFQEVLVPRPKEGEVLIKVKATSICGTDHHIYIWNEWAQNRIKPPQIMGHELAGEIVELGPSVRRAKIGDYVSAETHVVCGHCVQCMIGQKEFCQNTKILGVDRDGCFAEYVTVPEENLWYNDPRIPPDVASIQEPLGNAIHTTLAGETRGMTMAIFGCGPIGLMAVAVAKATGASFVLAIDINDYRLGIAKKLGADVIINSRRENALEIIMEKTKGVGVDAVLEMSGASQVFGQIFKAVRAGGRVSLLGLPAKPIPVDFSNEVVMRGVTIQGITGRKIWANWLTGRELLASGRLDLSPIITHKMALSEYQKGMDLMTSGDCGKVILYPEGV